jgi:serine O-acetyltransferase
MEMNISIHGLSQYVSKQLKVFFPDEKKDIECKRETVLALERYEYCVDRINRKYFRVNGCSQFNYLHGDQYCMYLYFLSNTMFKEGNQQVAEKIFLLNKLLFGIDVFYSIELPNIFYFCHPLGTILGNATYCDYLVVYQGVTVGSDLDEYGDGGIYPVLGQGCVLLANVSIIGRCNIGDNVTLGAGTFIRNLSVADNSTVFGMYPNNFVKKNNRDNLKYYFGSYC